MAVKKKKLNQEKLFTQIASMFLKHKPTDLTYSDISRFTGVPRPTLYYYFGNSPEKLIHAVGQFAVQTFVQLYSLENVKLYKNWEEFHKARLNRLFKTINRYPWAPELFIRYRKSTGVFGTDLQVLEKKYFKGIALACLHFNGFKPRPYAVGIFSYTKLGIAYGLVQEAELWKLKNQDLHIKMLVDHLHNLLTPVLSMKFE